MADWTLARTAIDTRVLANASTTVNLSGFNGAKFSYPAEDFTTPANAVWMRHQVDNVPLAEPLGISALAPMHRRGLLTLSFYLMSNTGEAYLPAVVNPVLEAFHRQEFSIVHMEDFEEPDYIGADGNHGGEWVRVDYRCGFYVEERTDGVVDEGYLRVESNPAAHGFAVQEVVGLNDSTDDWQKLIATTAGYANISQAGVVFHVASANDFIVALSGSLVTITAHGLTGALYVSQGTSGLITSTVPTTGVSWRIGTAVDANRIAVLHEQPIEL